VRHVDGGVAVAAVNGSVVLVEVSFRVNAIGFLALEELSRDDPRGVSGNYGIMVRRCGIVPSQCDVRSS
jgi:hypothetical protein